jgi:hypothetical protein
MKKLRQFLSVIFLTLALTLSVPAGDILGPGTVSLPPPPPDYVVTDDTENPGASDTGDILTPGVAELAPGTNAALELLRGILSLF